MKQGGFHRNKTSIAHFSRSLATSWRTVLNCFCQSTSSHFKTWSSAYSLTNSLRRTPAKPAIARKGISSGTSSSAVSKSVLNCAGSRILEPCKQLLAGQSHRKGLGQAPAVLCRRQKSMSRLCKICARVNQKFWRCPKRSVSLQLLTHGPCNHGMPFSVRGGGHHWSGSALCPLTP
jgi:hypothetical protein